MAHALKLALAVAFLCLVGVESCSTANCTQLKRRCGDDSHCGLCLTGLQPPLNDPNLIDPSSVCERCDDAICAGYNRKGCVDNSTGCGTCMSGFVPTGSGDYCLLCSMATAPFCDNLNRFPCGMNSSGPNTCGVCKPGYSSYYTSESNAPCLDVDHSHCDREIECAELNRWPCGAHTEISTCGECKPGTFNSKEPGPGNSHCKFSDIDCSDDRVSDPNCAFENRRPCGTTRFSNQCGHCLPDASSLIDRGRCYYSPSTCAYYVKTYYGVLDCRELSREDCGVQPTLNQCGPCLPGAQGKPGNGMDPCVFSSTNCTGYEDWYCKDKGRQPCGSNAKQLGNYMCGACLPWHQEDIGKYAQTKEGDDQPECHPMGCFDSGKCRKEYNRRGCSPHTSGVYQDGWCGDCLSGSPPTCALPPKYDDVVVIPFPAFLSGASLIGSALVVCSVFGCCCRRDRLQGSQARPYGRFIAPEQKQQSNRLRLPPAGARNWGYQSAEREDVKQHRDAVLRNMADALAADDPEPLRRARINKPQQLQQQRDVELAPVSVSKVASAPNLDPLGAAIPKLVQPSAPQMLQPPREGEPQQMMQIQPQPQMHEDDLAAVPAHARQAIPGGLAADFVANANQNQNQNQGEGGAVHITVNPAANAYQEMDAQADEELERALRQAADIQDQHATATAAVRLHQQHHRLVAASESKQVASDDVSKASDSSTVSAIVQSLPSSSQSTKSQIEIKSQGEAATEFVIEGQDDFETLAEARGNRIVGSLSPRGNATTSNAIATVTTVTQRSSNPNSLSVAQSATLASSPSLHEEKDPAPALSEAAEASNASKNMSSPSNRLHFASIAAGVSMEEGGDPEAVLADEPIDLEPGLDADAVAAELEQQLLLNENDGKKASEKSAEGTSSSKTKKERKIVLLD